MKKFALLILLLMFGCGGGGSSPMAATFPIAVIGDSLSRDLSPHIPADNLSVGGASTADTIENIRGKELDYKTILIMSGINDLVVDGLSVEQIIVDYASLIDAVKAKTKAVIIVQSTLPTSGTYDNVTIQKLNRSLQALCASKRVVYVDLWVVFYDIDSNGLRFTSDGVHLTSQGYALWAEYVRSLYEITS